MISSLLDTDLYKFTMMQVVLHQFPGAQVEYRFRCRTEGVDLRAIEAPFRAALKQLCSLRFTEDELAYLRGLRYIKPDFVDFLRLFQLNEAYVELDLRSGFEISIRGPWLHTILFEVPLLAIIFSVGTRTPQAQHRLRKRRRRPGVQRLQRSARANLQGQVKRVVHRCRCSRAARPWPAGRRWRSACRACRTGSRARAWPSS